MGEELESRRLLTAAGGVASHIIVFHDDADVGATAAEVAKEHGLDVEREYRHALRGMAAVVPEGRLNGLQRDSRVAYVEANQTLGIAAQGVPTGVNRIGVAERLPGIATAADTGDLEVDIAIIDTGIDGDHPDLRVAGGANFSKGNSWEDGNGHGTHVAGTAAARDNDTGVVGVAPGARLWAVRVLDNNGSGWMSDIIAGVDWVTQNAGHIEVANMSLGGQGQSATLRTALQNSVAAGVVYYVAAGNSDADVYGPDGKFGTSDDYIPASYPEVGAVSALADSDGKAGGGGSSTSYGPDDSFATFSNYSGSVVADNPVKSQGAAIDLLMPGVNIHSTWKGDSYHTISGTSMASPHAAGLAALKIAELVAANGGSRNYNGDKTADGLDVIDQNDVYFVRQALIAGGMDQASGNRLVADLLGSTGEPEAHQEPLGWAIAAPAHDLAVTEIIAPDPIVVGDSVTVGVVVENQGTLNEAVSVKLVSDNGTPSDTMDDIAWDFTYSELAAGSSVTLTTTWSTAGSIPVANVGSHTLTATVATVEGESDTSDNVLSKMVSVELERHDVAIVALNAPSSVVQKDSVAVDVTVANEGNRTETVEVTLTDTPPDGGTAGAIRPSSYSVTLDPGASTVVTFIWDTTNASPGNHTFTATASISSDLVTDAELGDNSASAVVTVNEPTTASTSDMYVWDMTWSEKQYGPGGSYHDISILVDVNQDIDATGEADGIAEATDGPAASATATFVLIHNTDSDPAFGSSGDTTWSFVDVPTDGSGQMTFNVKFAPAGDYQAQVTSLSHASLVWNKGLDAENPNTYLGFAQSSSSVAVNGAATPQVLSPTQDVSSSAPASESPQVDDSLSTSQEAVVDAAFADLGDGGFAPRAGDAVLAELDSRTNKRKIGSDSALDSLSTALQADGLLSGGLFG